MSSSLIPDEPFVTPAQSVVVTDHQLTVCWPDGRTLSVPLAWYPRLVHGTPAERGNVEVGAFGITWPDLDEDVSYKSLLLGWKSGETSKSKSFQQWLAYRARGEKVPVRTLPLPPKLAKESERSRTPAAGRGRSGAKPSHHRPSSTTLKRRSA